MFLGVKRVLKGGFTDFWRNGSVSFSAVLVMTITLFVMGSLIFIGVLLNTSLEALEEKVDVNIYFTPEANEDQVLAVQDGLETLSPVQAVEYVSREEAIEGFRDRREEDDTTIQALDELEQNPLGARLNVQAQNIDDYERVAGYLEESEDLTTGTSGTSIIENVNYYQNEQAINRLSSVIGGAERLGIAVIFVLAVISVIITYNTIRMAIYTSREEIGIMRLVGAGRAYVRGPFVVEGALYGFISAIIAMAIFYPVTLWLGDVTANFFLGVNIYEYYLANFGQIFLVLVVAGVLLGAISAFLAIRRHLKV